MLVLVHLMLSAVKGELCGIQHHNSFRSVVSDKQRGASGEVFRPVVYEALGQKPLICMEARKSYIVSYTYTPSVAPEHLHGEVV